MKKRLDSAPYNRYVYIYRMQILLEIVNRIYTQTKNELFVMDMSLYGFLV